MRRNNLNKCIVIVALIALLVLPPLPGGCIGDAETLVINEVVTSNGASLSDKTYGSPDWIELYNSTDRDISLHEYRLAKKRVDPDDALPLPDVVIRAGACLVLYANKAQSSYVPGGVVCLDFNLSRGGDLLLLTDNRGNVLQELKIPMLERDISYARRDDGSYGYCAAPTPNGANTTIIFDTMEHALRALEEEDADEGDCPILINEIVSKNVYSLRTDCCDKPDWIELYNPSAEAFSLSRFALCDSPGKSDVRNLQGVTVPGGGYLVVRCCAEGCDKSDGHVCLRMGIQKDGAALFLYDSRERLVSELTVPALPADISYARRADGAYGYCPKPSPGAENGQIFSTLAEIGLFDKEGVYFSEVSAVHERGKQLTDWIELYNGGTQSADLSGCYLSNDRDDLQLWQIGTLVISAGEYAVIEASSHVTRQRGDAAANFGISSTGTTLFLSNPMGEILDIFETGVLRLGLTSGRIAGDNSTARVFFKEPTPGKPNSEVYVKGYSTQPTFSETALYQSKPFALELSCPTEGASIYYTTDGSAPTTASHKYEKAIPIDKNTVIRAISDAPDLLVSDAFTQHYLFEQPHSLPVMCVAISERDLSTVCIARAPSIRVEKSSVFSYYERDGLPATVFTAGLSLKGNASIRFRQKSFSVSLRPSLGQSSVAYPFFDGYAFSEFTNLVLRSASQDRGSARLADSFAARTAQGMMAEAAATRPVVVYISGEYYGIYDLGEDLNAGYFATHHGAEKDLIEVIRHNIIPLRGTAEEIKRVRTYARRNNMEDPVKFAEYCKWVDVEYFTDYYIARTYMGEWDTYNQKYWRTTDYAFRWRPVLSDMDYSMKRSVTENVMAKYFRKGPGVADPGLTTNFDLFAALRQNEAWRDYCVERYVWAICTRFNTERLTGILDEMVAEMEPEMPRHIARWGLPVSMTHWKTQVAVRYDYVERRPAIMLKQVQNHFAVPEARMQELIDKYSQSDAPEPRWTL